MTRRPLIELADDETTQIAIAWLDRAGPDVAITLVEDSGLTIVPTVGGDSDASVRALLAENAGRASGGSVELRIGEVIAEGGMGVIRAAEQVGLARQVAVKTLKAQRRDPRTALDLLREAWITGSLEHPNVVPVHHLGADADGNPLIVLKRIAGVEWSSILRDDAEIARRFGATDVLAWNLDILLQVLNAVRFAHSRGIVHRDLKPSNVMIGDFGEVYVLDWGIAVSTRDDGSGRLPLARDATRLAGTPSYMAPEMLVRDGAPPVSAQTDVYLAGAVLFELITGVPPHEGTTAIAIIASMLTSRPVIPASVPAELAQICMHALEAEPADRFTSADAMRLALQGYLEHRASAQIAARAAVGLGELMREIASRTPGASMPAVGAVDPSAHREAVYRQFGACRAGFQEALSSWRHNAEARAGLARATIAVAEYELASGDPRAAVRLLGELADPPPLLAEARRAAITAAARQDALERLGQARDSLVGRRLRWAVTVVFGAVFSASPWLSAAFPTTFPLRTHGGLIAWSSVLMVATFGVAWWARDLLVKASLNRGIVLTTLLLFATQIAVGIAGPAIGVTLAQSEIFLLLFWAVISALLAIHSDAYLAVGATGFVAGFFIATCRPEWRLQVMGSANLLFALNALWRWRPGRVDP